MKVSVVVYGQRCEPEEELHAGPEVTEHTENGELVIKVRDVAGQLVHYCRYAAGQWGKVFLVEGMTADVITARATQQAYTAAHAITAAPVSVPGNSGPGY